jgi:ABC-type transport system involved in multi-copper enzyme maturation permease subunit
MLMGPFLKRELLCLARRGTARSDRCALAVVAALVVAGCAVAWEWHGWDRTSVAGAAEFALWVFGWTAGLVGLLTIALVPDYVAPAIAAERDRASLDALLATQLSALEIVLGAIGAGLLRLLGGLAALVPVLEAMVFLGGVDPRLALLAVAALVSTGLALASLGAAVSACARSAASARSYAVGLGMLWMLMPQALLLVLPGIWPAAARLLRPLALTMLDSTPLGLVLSLSGVVPRGPLALAVARMITLQLAAAVALVVWAAFRLRPASRALHEFEARATSRRFLRARWQPRPACGDDPVLWHAMHPGRCASRAALMVDRLFHASWIGVIVGGIAWFALPAFAELLEFGYGPAAARTTVPEMNPVLRVLACLLAGLPAGPEPGQARGELNFVLRLITGVLDAFYVLIVAGAAAETVARERERNTWLGLLATPLGGRDIVRGKLLGSLWQTRGLAALMLALWIVGLLAGAVHPLGFLATLAGMGVSAGFLAAAGVSASLWSPDRHQATSRVVGPLILFLSLAVLPAFWPGTASAVPAIVTMPLQTWAALLSYDDVDALVQGRALPGLVPLGVGRGPGTWIVLAAWLFSTAAQAIAGLLLMRAAVRGFDGAVGRPVRGRGDSDPALASGQ